MNAIVSALPGRTLPSRHRDALIGEARERQRRRRRRLALVFVSAVVVFTVVGYDLSRAAPSRSYGRSLPNVCALVTNVRVAGLLGSRIAARAATGNRLYRQCQWTGASLGGFMPTKRSLQIDVMRQTRAEFDRAMRRAPAARRVAGLGESAYAVDQAGTPFLDVYAHGLAIELIASLVTHPLTVEEAAARAAIHRLP